MWIERKRHGFPATLEDTSRTRAERVVAAGRLVLAASTLFAIWLDPSQPAKYADLTYALMVVYVGYSLALLALVWTSRGPFRLLGLLTHIADLGLFSVFMYLTEGPGSPFFSYFLFALVGATIRWQWRGAVWTAAAALVAFNGMGVYASRVLHDPDFALNRFIIRSVYLLVTATLLAYLGANEMRERGEIARLASWPRLAAEELAPLLTAHLAQAGAVLGTPRLLLAWNENEADRMHLALWTADRLDTWTEEPGTYAPLVSPPLQDSAFFCLDCGAAAPVVRIGSPAGLTSWRGPALHPGLRARFAVLAVVSVPMQGASVAGRLFALDRRGITADDLAIGELVARQLATGLDQFYVTRELRRAAAVEERIRLSRDLHDGVVQTLTGTALRLHAAERLLDGASDAARRLLGEIRAQIADEQRDLRFYIQDLKPTGLAALEEGAGFEAALRDLARRVESVWNLSVQLELGTAAAPRVPGTLLREVYRLVQEACVNAARHGGATQAVVTLALQGRELAIVVADNGHGFPFQGRFDHVALAAQTLGPRALSERLTALGGTLALESSETGARVEMRVPVPAS